MVTEFPKFIIIATLEETPLAKLSAFLTDKIIFSRENRNFLVELDNKRHAKNLIKMKTYDLKCKVYPHERLNTLKRVNC